MHYSATIDAVHAVLWFLNNEYGNHGYSLWIEGDGVLGAIAHCRHTDGSEFIIHSDRWGNILEES